MTPFAQCDHENVQVSQLGLQAVLLSNERWLYLWKSIPPEFDPTESIHWLSALGCQSADNVADRFRTVSGHKQTIGHGTIWNRLTCSNKRKRPQKRVEPLGPLRNLGLGGFTKDFSRSNPHCPWWPPAWLHASASPWMPVQDNNRQDTQLLLPTLYTEHLLAFQKSRNGLLQKRQHMRLSAWPSDFYLIENEVSRSNKMPKLSKRISCFQ